MTMAKRMRTAQMMLPAAGVNADARAMLLRKRPPRRRRERAIGA
jgi:hypothetical protein